jgi:hypothetical protein
MTERPRICAGSGSRSSGDWNPGARRLVPADEAFSSGRVWIPGQGVVWNPIEYKMQRRRQAMLAMCGCPVCLPEDMQGDEWSCKVVNWGEDAETGLIAM